MLDKHECLSDNYKGVMVSSTFTDLIQHRAALIKAIESQEFKSVVMENDSAKTDIDVLDSSLHMVQKASAYIGLVSHRYGQIPDDNQRNPDRLSLTELEYNEAQRLERPILIFIMGDNHPITKNDVETDQEKIEKLDLFREKAKLFRTDSKIHRVYTQFDTLEEFKEKAIHAIANLRRYIEGEKSEHNHARLVPSSQFSNQALLQKYVSKELSAFDVIKLPSILPPGVPLVIPINKLYIDLPMRLTRPWRHDEMDRINEKLGEVELYFSNQRLLHTSAFLQIIYPKLNLNDKPCTIGERLREGIRLVVVGDPGSGKTTLLSFLAFEYLQRFSNKSHIMKDGLPNLPMLPIVIQCRDINLNARRDLISIVHSTLVNRGFLPREADILTNILFSRADSGGIILLVDGLDEISDVEARQSLCRTLCEWSRRSQQCRVVITSRPVGFGVVEADLLTQFDLVNIASFERSHKEQFCRLFSKFIKIKSTSELPSFEQQLVNAVCDGRQVAALTENIQMLTLIASVFAMDGRLSESRTEVISRSVEVSISSQEVDALSTSYVFEQATRALITSQRSGKTSWNLTANDLIPHLRALALAMRQDGAQRWPEQRVLEVIESSIEKLKDSDKHRKNCNLFSSSEWLESVIERIGILQIVGEMQDQHGVSHRVIQFWHQSFQEYFAGQALASLPSALDKIQKLLATLEIKERPIESLASGKMSEPVVADHWQETLRFAIGNLKVEDGIPSPDDALSLILPHPDTPPLEHRARAIFSLQCLAEQPNVHNDTAQRIFEAMADSIQPGDGYNLSLNTQLDKAVVAVALSPLGEPCISYLSEIYILSRGEIRMGVGRMLMLSLEAQETETRESLYTLDEILHQFLTGTRVESIQAGLILTSGFYRLAGNEQITPFVEELSVEANRTRVLNILLDRLSGDEAVSSSAAWALMWASNAKFCDTKKLDLWLDDETLPAMLSFLEDITHDELFQALVSLVISLRPSTIPVPAQQDWIYEWAVVADGGKPQWALVKPANIDCTHIASELRKFRERCEDVEANRIVDISLGRLGIYELKNPSAHGQHLRNILQDNDPREESAIYLALAGTHDAAVELYGAATRPDSEDDHGSVRGFLALIGNGDFTALQRAINEDPNEGRTDAYALALAGIKDDRGRTYLRSLLESENEDLKTAARNALDKLNEWVNEFQIPTGVAVMDSLFQTST